jgi:DNA-binding SARP family transcriptional activator
MSKHKARQPQHVAVLMLGVPQFLFDKRPSDVIRRKNRALVYYLAAHTQPLTREQVLSFFWPDHDHAAAQQILRTMLSDLRKHLGESLVVDDETLALSSDTFVDARAFESNLQLYRDDFLEGFSLAGAPLFDDWVAVERERYRLLAIRGFTQLARLHESQHNYAESTTRWACRRCPKRASCTT